MRGWRGEILGGKYCKPEIEEWILGFRKTIFIYSVNKAVVTVNFVVRVTFKLC